MLPVPEEEASPFFSHSRRHNRPCCTPLTSATAKPVTVSYVTGSFASLDFSDRSFYPPLFCLFCRPEPAACLQFCTLSGKRKSSLAAKIATFSRRLDYVTVEPRVAIVIPQVARLLGQFADHFPNKKQIHSKPVCPAC